MILSKELNNEQVPISYFNQQKAYFPVLDHGFVSLVDVMGNDGSIVQAARVSYGEGTKTKSDDSGLINYLMRHRHTTPFEMVEFKFHIGMPIFIARQWIRHRTACLSGDTQLYFDLPSGQHNDKWKKHGLMLKQLWNRWQPTVNRTRPDKQRNAYHRRDKVKSMRLRQMNEDTLEIQHTHIKNIYSNGIKEVFEIILESGHSIKSTNCHRFMFSDGWDTLKNKVRLVERKNKAIYNQGNWYIYVNGVTCFKEGHKPWNKGKTYKLGLREPSIAFLESNRLARSGSASNFWKGGISLNRANIGRWTTEQAHKVHTENDWICQLCGKKKSTLHCHHIIPVWADETLAKKINNLTTVCVDCHREINKDELAYVEKFNGPPLKSEYKKKPRVAWNKITIGKLCRIREIRYVGLEETYDVEVEGPYHNFVGNGIITHNSVNEYSGRYSIMPMLFYTPQDGGSASNPKKIGREEVRRGLTASDWVDTTRAVRQSGHTQ